MFFNVQKRYHTKIKLLSDPLAHILKMKQREQIAEECQSD